MARDQHPLEVYGMETILEDGVKVEDLEVKDLLILMLEELKTINIQLQAITEIEVVEEDI